MTNIHSMTSEIVDRPFLSTSARIPFSQKDVDTSLPERFEKIVRLCPDAIAIKSEPDVLTYGELNSRANQIARIISTKSGQRRRQVGLLVEKGAGQVAGMLGILKSGNIFVPIDSSLPKERIKAILQQSQSTLLLTDRSNESTGRELMGNAFPLIVLESINADVDDANLGLPISSLDPAYIIYTSGSTGQPKGILDNHAHQLHAVMRRTNSENVHRGDRIALLPNGTSNAVGNTFLALLNGAALLPFDVNKESASRLAKWLCEERITICQIASPLFRNLCSVLPDNQMFPELRLLRLRSESVYAADVELYKKHFLPTCIMVNGLSSSETGSFRAFHIHHDTVIELNEVPVGYPLEGMEVSLLDDDGNKVDFNEVGEIVVRSKYLSSGYWNQPDLTKEKFKPDPQGGDCQLYYTGDLGLMLPDGCLIHKGRKDFRIKIRGYGVDLIEVEKVLLSYPGIRQVIVFARQNEVGESYLVGYFTSDIQPPPNVSELRMFLKDKLADYMIPSAFMALDSIPLTANGKIDRNALPSPDRSRPHLNAAYVAPRSFYEKKLVSIWEEILKMRPIGVHDDFFDLGGQSLLGSKIVAQIEREFQTEIPVGWLFESRTIAVFAKQLNVLIDTNPNIASTPFIGLHRGTDDKHIFCFPYTGGFLNEYSRFIKIAQLIGGDYSFYGLRARGTDGTLQVFDSVEEMAFDYVKTIKSIQPKGPYIIIAECGGAAEAYETARQLRASGEGIRLLAFFDGHLSGNLFNDLKDRLLGQFGYRIHDFRTLCKFIISGTVNTIRQMTRLTGRQSLHHLLNKLRRVESLRTEARFTILTQGAPAELDRKSLNRRVLRHLKRALEDHQQAVIRYRYHWFRYWAPPFPGKVTLLVNEEWHSRNPTLGWESVETGGVEVHKIPGNHLTYITNHVEYAAEIFKKCLEKSLDRVH